ncbi:MAG: hypothetical protein FWG75_10865 [Cystobacterineae bacterium]|nr:hypothetical protein [Cystobacterineae bacterium]
MFFEEAVSRPLEGARGAGGGRGLKRHKLKAVEVFEEARTEGEAGHLEEVSGQLKKHGLKGRREFLRPKRVEGEAASRRQRAG